MQPSFKKIAILVRKHPVEAATEGGSVIFGVALGLYAALQAGLAEELAQSLVVAGLALACGFYLLTKTSDMVVHNASALGRQAGISTLVLGICLGLLTSLPELFVSAGAAFAGKPGIGIGNIVGSNIANLLLILAGTAVIRAVPAKGEAWKFDMLVMGLATLVFGAQLVAGRLYPLAGVVLLAGLGFYLWKMLRDVRESENQRKKRRTAAEVIGAAAKKNVEGPLPEHSLTPLLNTLFLLAGVAGLVGAAGFSVEAAVGLGAAVGVSPAVVGLLAVAVGTSLPEMMVNFKSALKGETELAVGNVLGSNIFNLILIGGLLSLTGANVPPDLDPGANALGRINMLAFAGSAALVAVVMLTSRKKGITRLHGIIGLALYALYTAVIFILGRV